MNNHLVLVSTHKNCFDSRFLYRNAVQKLISNMNFFYGLGYFTIYLSELISFTDRNYGHKHHLV